MSLLERPLEVLGVIYLVFSFPLGITFFAVCVEEVAKLVGIRPKAQSEQEEVLGNEFDLWLASTSVVLAIWAKRTVCLGIKLGPVYRMRTITHLLAIAFVAFCVGYVLHNWTQIRERLLAACAQSVGLRTTCAWAWNKLYRLVWHPSLINHQITTEARHPWAVLDSQLELDPAILRRTNKHHMVSGFFWTKDLAKGLQLLGKHGAGSKGLEMLADEDVCSICLEQFQERSEVATLPCGHCFDAACVGGWFGRHLSCPKCRTRFPWELASRKVE